MRGFGARSSFGIRGIKVFVDGSLAGATNRERAVIAGESLRKPHVLGHVRSFKIKRLKTLGANSFHIPGMKKLMRGHAEKAVVKLFIVKIRGSKDDGS